MKRHPPPAALIPIIASLTLPLSPAREISPPSLADGVSAFNNREFTTAIAIANRLLQENPKNPKAAELLAGAYQNRGEENFRQAKIDASLADFDAFLKTYPQRAPHHWQRGISLYYAGRFADAKSQFESHQTVNPQDVENAVWHFLCTAKIRDLGPGTARKNLFEITRDRRIPMKEIHALFKGAGSEDDVMQAANAVADNNPDALFYAHLYLGLYHEALGNAEKSLAHIRKAAVDHLQPHYMGTVATVHLTLRTTDDDGK